MNDKTKRWGAIAIVCITAGLIITLVANLIGAPKTNRLSLFGLNINLVNPLSTQENERHEEQISFSKSQVDSIRKLEIEWNIGTIEIMAWDKDTIDVQFSYSDESNPPQFVIDKDKLVISSSKEDKFSLTLGIGIGLNDEVNATIRIPATMIVDEADAQLNAGTMKISDLTVLNELNVQVNAGLLEMSNIISEHESEIRVNAGEARLDGCFKKELKVRVNAGSLTVLNSISAADTSIKAETNAGSANINGVKISGLGNEYNDVKANTENSLDAEVNAGELKITYAE